MAFSEDFLYSLKQANNIDSVFSSYVDLKRRGHTLVCRCPFHSEKTPSCTIYPDGQNFYCFGCHAGGDVITFIMRIENLSYPEAVQFLAERAGIPVPEDDNFKKDNTAHIKKKVYEINRAAARHFYSNLKTEGGKVALAYLLNRGLTVETIKKYGIGYAENSWGDMRTFLLSEGFSESDIVLSGVCGKGRNDRVYDLFRHRVMFPIIDLRGNVIAFGGRKLEGSDESAPKYVNSSDTPVFKKSRNLFSLNYAKNHIKDTLLLAEGYMDVIAINQAGFENVVATLGTALTPEQARLMASYAKKVVIAYDSDEAGQKATHKAISLLSEAGVETRVLKMEGAKDPDEYIQKFGALRFKMLIDNSYGAINFELLKCKSDLDIQTDTGRVEYLKRAIVVLANIVNLIEREVYISKVSSEITVSKEVITAEVEALIRKNKKTTEKKEWRAITNNILPRNDEINPEAVKFPKESRVEKSILSYIFANPEEMKNVAQNLTEKDFVTSFHRRIYAFCLSLAENERGFDLSYFNGEFSHLEMGKISEIAVKAKEFPVSYDNFQDLVNTLLGRDDVESKKGEDLSDDELRDFLSSLKNKKS